MSRQRLTPGKKNRTLPSDMLGKSHLPRWIINALEKSGVKKVSAVATLSDIQLLAMPGIGLRSVALIRAEQRRINAERRKCLQDEQTQA
ncbi:hypothetical protein [Agrobacterium sp. CG674]|jgi:hypothetical protein